MFLRAQLILWGTGTGLALLSLAWSPVDPEQAQNMRHAAGVLAGVAVVLFFAWPAPAVAVVEAPTLRDLLGEKAICPHCLQPNPVRRVRCRRCIAPIGWQATTDAFQHKVAYGWALGALARVRVPGPLLLVAAWLVFPVLLVGYVSSWVAWLEGSGVSLGVLEFAYLVFLLVNVPYLWAAVFGLWNVTRSFVRNRPAVIAALDSDLLPPA